MKARRAWREEAAVRAMYWVMGALLVGALLAVMVVPARAEEGWTGWTDEKPAAPSPLSSPLGGEDVKKWTTLDTSLQAVFLTTLAIDRGQTVALRDHQLEEIGWARNFIGAHPSARQVNQYFAACAVAHTAIAVVLPKPWRTIWQSFWIGAEVNTINMNVNAGISIRF